MAMKTFHWWWIKTIILCLFVTISVSKCPQVSVDSFLVRFCDSHKCIDRVTLQGCVNPEDVLDDTEYIQIYTNVPLLRRGFIHDLPNLSRISAVSTDFTGINPGAFLNLPKLDWIRMPDSKIKNIFWGVFSNTSISYLDLTDNFITTIENEAFSNMPNLKQLFLGYNRLTSYNKDWFNNSHNLEEIGLNNNQIERIQAGAFDVFPNLKHVDLSFNVLKQLDPWIFNNVKKLNLLDLTGNKLWWIQNAIFGTGTEVAELRVSLNFLSYLEKGLLDSGKVKSLVLHPNPWQCACLEQIREWMRSNNATLKNDNNDYRIFYHSGFPECVYSTLHEDTCPGVQDDEFYKIQDTYFEAVNYTSWTYKQVTRAKPECECA